MQPRQCGSGDLENFIVAQPGMDKSELMLE